MSRLALIDGDIIVYRIACKKKWKKVNPLEAPSSLPNSKNPNMVEVPRTQEEVDKDLHSLLTTVLDNIGTTMYVGFISGTRRECFRTEVSVTKEYKGNRKGEKPEWHNYVQQRLLSHYGYINMGSLEADDGMSILQTRDIAGLETVIATDDKDLDGTEGLHYNIRDAILYNVTKESATDMLWVQTLFGDSTDNILGCAYERDMVWSDTHKTKPGQPYKLRTGVSKNQAKAYLAKYKQSQYQGAVLNEYIRRFGYSKGVAQFAEMFALVYMLRDGDIEFETPLVLMMPPMYHGIEEPEVPFNM